MLRVTQTKATNQIIPVSQPGKEKTSDMNERNESKKDQIVTAIVGDYMVKDIYGWELSDNKEKVVVKHFSRSTTEDTYMKPPLKRNPYRFIIHVGT